MILTVARCAPLAIVAPAPPTPSPLPDAPAGDLRPAWDKLKSVYAESTPPKVEEAAAKEDERFAGLTLRHLKFTNTRGEEVTGLLLLPKGTGPHPLALVLHGLGSNKENTLEFFGKALVEKGVACLALDAPGHGERKKPGETGSAGPGFALVVRGGITDYRQIIGYLKTRADIDTDRIGLIGNSMGAMMGAIVAGVDERIRAAALVVGGDPLRSALRTAPEATREQIEYASPSNYVGHISPRPVLLVNALDDETIREAAARRLQDAAQEPKEILWVKAGHVLPEPERRKAVDWLAAKLTDRQ